MQGVTKPSNKGKWGFRLSGIEDLKQLAAQLNVSIGAVEDVSILAEPVQAGGLLVPNSLAVHPMEAADGDRQGRPGKLTFRRYERFAAGGAGLLWAEAIAVVPEGRANPRQLWLNENSKESFAALIKRMKQSAESSPLAHRPVIVAQLTHSGRYSKPVSMPAARCSLLDSQIANRKSQIVTDEYLDELSDAYVKAAKMAFEVGFDAVDIKSCHGYLISELLACYSRGGKYGGSFENRTRFLLEVIDKIHKKLGEDRPVVTRLGLYDAVPYPFGWGVDRQDYTKPDLTEPRKLIALLAEHGVKMINVTVANPHHNPHYGRPFNEPIIDGYASPEHPLVGVSRLIGLAGEIQKEFPDVAVVGTGYSWLRTLFPSVAAASKANGLATIIGAGRLAFAYPDFAKDIIRKGRLDRRKVCIACSKCTQIMVDGGMIGCVVHDNEIYGPIYEQSRCDESKRTSQISS